MWEFKLAQKELSGIQTFLGVFCRVSFQIYMNIYYC